MGFFRLLLAVLVLTAHGNITTYTGIWAVECFFIISGFYMQMILTEKYAGQRFWALKFWESRLLRIFIPYWVILFCMFLLLAIQYSRSAAEHIPFLALLRDRPLSIDTLISTFTNLFIIGANHLKEMRSMDDCTSALFDNLVIQPIWSVDIELLFYMVAPLLLMLPTSALICIVLATATGKAVLLDGRAAQIFYGPLHCTDGLLDGLPALELGVFLVGALGYRWHNATTIKIHYWPCLTAAFLLLVEVSVGLKFQSAVVDMAVYQSGLLCTAILVPLLFKASDSNRFDRALGELSYPFYLWHVYCLWLIASILSAWPYNPYIVSFIAGVLALLAAFLTSHYIETPLSRFRHRRFRRDAE